MSQREKITEEEKLEILKEEFFEKELKRQKEEEKQIDIEIEVKQHRKAVAKNASIQKELKAEGIF